MIEITKIYYIVFGIISILGGLMGYLKKKSIASLIAGSISGILLLSAAFLIPERFHTGLAIGLVASVALAGKFIPDYIHKKALFPGGVMALLSIIGAVLTVVTMYQRY